MENKKKTKGYITWFVAVTMVLYCVITYSTIKKIGLVSQCYLILNLLTYYLFFRECYSEETIIKYTVFIVLYCLFAICISWFSSSREMDFELMTSFFTFIISILYIGVVACCRVTKRLVYSILFFGIISAAIFPFCFYIQGIGNEDGKLLTMNFSNPNLTGMYIAQSMLYLILGFVLFKSKLIKPILIFLFILDFKLLEDTGARNAMIVVLAVIALSGFMVLKKRNKFSKKVMFFIAAFPLLFAVVYLLTINFIIEKGWFDFMISEGKNLTSRQEMWMRIPDNLKGIHWLFGDYFKLRGNLHNTHVTVLGSFGIVGITAIIFYFYDIMKSVNSKIHNKKQMICLVAFFGTVLMGNGEAALFYGSCGMYVAACEYLILARYDWEDEESEGKTNESITNQYDLQGQKYRP